MARESAEIAGQRRLLGEHLAAFREAAELTQGQLARKVFRHRTTLVHIEKGRRRADEQFWATVDDAVGASGVLLMAFHEIEADRKAEEYRVRAAKLADARRRAATGPERSANLGWLKLRDVSSLPAHGGAIFGASADPLLPAAPSTKWTGRPFPTASDEFLGLGGFDGEDRASIADRTTDVVTLPGGTAVPAATARAEPALAKSLLATLEHYVTIDNLVGSRGLQSVVPGHVAFIEDLLVGSDGRHRAQLLYVGARYAEFAGWLYQEAGDLRGALRWSNTALQFAQAVGDDHLSSYIWMRKSNIGSDGRWPDLALAFARAALEDSRVLPPRLRAVALRQEAHAQAMAGDMSACARALDEAYDYASAADDGDADFVAYCTPGYVEMEAAHCWVELGRPQRAIATLQRCLAGWQPHYRRDLGLCLARLAVAWAASGESTSAVAVAEQAIAIAADTGSYRTTSQLFRVPKLLAAAGAEDNADQLRRMLARLR